MLDVLENHSDSERGNPLPPLHGLLFPTSSKIIVIGMPVTGTSTGLCRFLSPRKRKKKGGGGGLSALAGTREYKQSNRNR